MRRRPLPHDVLTVIRLASGSHEAMATATASTAHDAGFIQAAAELYLRQVVCFRGASPRRTLGVAETATREQLRQHMRELVLWLHPDRNPQGSDPALMQRVLGAWKILDGRGADDVGERRVARPSAARRSRRIPAYRPSWVAQPVPKAMPRWIPGRRARMAIGFAVALAGVALPSFSMSFDLADGLLQFLSDQPDSRQEPIPTPPEDHRPRPD